MTCEYAAHDHIWRAAWPEYGHLRAQAAQEARLTGAPKRRFILCLDCLERRLGRPLKPEDFRLELPVNAGIVLGMRMARQ